MTMPESWAGLATGAAGEATTGGSADDICDAVAANKAARANWKNLIMLLLPSYPADGEGFEPPVDFRPLRFSRPPH